MKKLLIVLLFALMASASYAQYRTYKNLYDVKDYKYLDTDRYNPTGPAIISFIVPGLGHVLIGEPLRGLGFYALSTGSLGLGMVGMAQMNENGDRNLGNILAIGGASLWVGSYIWGISNVIRMAKIKNMHLRDQKFALHLYPSFQLMPHENFSSAKAAGLTVAFNF